MLPRRPATRPAPKTMKTALRVPAHDAEGQEDREHHAEEQRPEHRHPEQECASEGLRVDTGRRDDLADVMERVPVADPVEGQEPDREQADDDEHLAPHGLAESVAGDRPDRRHLVSPPTASTYTSSSVEVSTRAPYTSWPPRTSSATRRGMSSRPASS